MKWLTMLIKPASSLCNMRCRYCFYADVSDRRAVRSFGIMQKTVLQDVINAALQDTDSGGNITFAFQGGEPTLAGLDYFRQFVEYAGIGAEQKGISINYTIQTNGLLIDDEWCVFLRDNHFLVGLSMDGPAQNHNRNRVDESYKGTWKRVSDTASLLTCYGVEFNILCVLTADNARHPEKLWQFFLQKGFKYLQFIPCLADLDQDKNVYSLTPQHFFDFYNVLFRLWKNELEKDNYISVKLFDDLANMLVFRKLTACGLNGSCTLQFIVEADGGVYPCDFYVLDEYNLGNLCKDSLETIRINYRNSRFHSLRKNLPETCRTCKFIKLCGSGCVRLRQSMYLDGDYCGFRNLLNETGDPLIRSVCSLKQ